MTLKSDLLTFGLFGQIFAWMLEVLPHLEARGLKPAWCVRSKNYGQAPDHNIFPGIIETAYAPEAGAEQLSLEALKNEHGSTHGGDFREANRCWNAFFKFPADVYTRLEEFCARHFAGQTVLGLHFRGTDKNTALWETNPVSPEAFGAVVEDFLQTHPEVTAIFVATDEARFLEAISRLRPVIAYSQARSADGQTLWDTHAAGDNTAVGKDAILDCLTLSRCRYVLKGMSALSAFAKVMNPELEAYRVSACKRDWFPEAAIPLYRGHSRQARRVLARLQRNDSSFRGTAWLLDKIGGRLDRLRDRLKI